MLNLREASGLPVALDGMSIKFLEGLPEVAASVRKLSEIKAVLYNQAAEGPEDIYVMYRGVIKPEHRDLIKKYSIRYDITVIRPGKIGSEYIKTAGHFHPRVPGQTLDFPEVYEVISGRAHYLMQLSEDHSFIELEDVVVVDAGPGDKVLIPPGYGHVTINPGGEPLVMSNCVGAEFTSDYGPYREAGGAAYFEVESDDKAVFIPNDHYSKKPAPRLVKAVDFPELGLVRGIPLYKCFTSAPEKMKFLVAPQEFGPVLSGIFR